MARGLKIGFPTHRTLGAVQGSLSLSGKDAAFIADFVPPSAAEQDWVDRANGAGVIWATDFRNSGDVNNWRFTNGIGWDPNPSSGDGLTVTRNGLGKKGGPCLRLREKTSGGEMGSLWWRNIDPAKTHYDTDPGAGIIDIGEHLYMQFAMKLNKTAIIDNQSDRISIKLAWFTTSADSNVGQECIMNIDFGREYPRITGSTLTQSNDADRWDSVYLGGGDYDMQPGSAYGFCNYAGGGNNNTSAGCWYFEPDRWCTFLMHIVPGTEGGRNTVVQLFAARPDQASYTKIYDRNDIYIPLYENHTGYSAVAFIHREEDRTTGMSNSDVLVDEVIVSSQTIACPIAMSTLTSVLSSQTDDTWKKIAAGSAASGVSSNQKGNRLIDATTMTTNQENLCNVWNGAGVIPDRKELAIVRPGGHGDVGTTNVLTLSMLDATPGWTNRSTQTVTSGGDAETNGAANYSDGTPRHTHSMRRPVGWQDGVWLAGMDNFASPLGKNSSAYFSFPRDTNLWVAHGKGMTDAEFNVSGASWHGGFSVVDKSTGYIWAVRQGTSNYDPAMFVFDANVGPTYGDLLAVYKAYMPWGYMQGVILHDLNPKLLLVGDGITSALHYFDITTPPATGSTLTPQTLTTSGSPARFPGSGAGDAPGWVYHKRSRAVLCWDDDGANIIKLAIPVNLTGGTYTWSTLASAGGDTPTGEAADEVTGTHYGTNGRFNLIEDVAGERDILVLVNDSSEPTFVRKIPTRGYR